MDESALEVEQITRTMESKMRISQSGAALAKTLGLAFWTMFAVFPAHANTISALQVPKIEQGSSSLYWQAGTTIVNGTNVVEVRHSAGLFQQRSNGWVEIDAGGNVGFTFAETGRDDWSVYLKDPTRNVTIQLDLHQKKIFYADASNQKFPLYDILSASAASSQAIAPNIVAGLNGRSVSEVRHAEGLFQQRPGGWVEIDAGGKVGFTFMETGRDDWSVYLKDPTRNVTIQLDLHQKKIFYADANNQKFPLYDIVSVSAASSQAIAPDIVAGLNGRNVSEVRHAEGLFRQRPDGWVEIDAGGKVGFTFMETGRDDWSVYLKDPTRNVTIQLDLHQKKIFYADASNQKFPLYEILSASAANQPMAADINGYTVGEVRHSEGMFRQLATGWVEIDATGNAGFTFTETGRDDWSVYLKDPSRNVTIQLDLFQKKIFYADANGVKQPLYDIVAALPRR